MDDQDKIAELTAEIARLHLVLAKRQAKIGKLMGEAARAGIAGAPASVPQLAVPQENPDINDDGHFESLLGSMHPLSKQCVIDFVNDWCRSALAATPAAPLPELTGPSAGSIGEDATFDDLLADYKLAESRSSYAKALAALVAYIDRRSAASPSPAPARQQEPSLDTAIERAAAICEGFCASDDNEEGINFILRQRAQRIRGLKLVETATPGACTEDKP